MSFVEELIASLKKQGALSEEKAESLLRRGDLSEKEIEKLLLKEKIVSPKELTQAKAEVLGFPHAEIPKGEKIPQEVLSQIPEELVSHYRVVPFGQEGGSLKVGLVNPEDIEAEEALDFFARLSKIPIKKYVISEEDFQKVSKQITGLRAEVTKALKGLEKEIEKPSKVKTSKAKPLPEKLKVLAEEAPITRVVEVILKYAVEAKASDIHIEPLRDKVKVRFRVDGVLHASLFVPKDALAGIVSRIKILSHLKIDETRKPQDGRIHLRFGKKEIDFRVSTFPTVEGEKVVMRVLDVSAGQLTLEELGLQGKSLKDIQKAIKAPFGTTLMTGPTGSGKTTTLYSILNILNQEGVNIVTLEDPVEYYLPGVNQSQVRPEIGYDFASGLRHVLRQDPDILMVGEIRDSETASLAIHAALTGHLVFSTLHTNNALGVIPRLMDMGVPDFLLPSALKLAVAQRLVGRLCENCKQKYSPSAKIQAMIERELKLVPEATRDSLNLKDLSLYRAKGCPECGLRGVRGRLGLFETLFMTSELEEVVVTKPTEENLKKEAQRQGMVTMRQDGILKALKGEVSIEEVIRATEESYK